MAKRIISLTLAILTAIGAAMLPAAASGVAASTDAAIEVFVTLRGEALCDNSAYGAASTGGTADYAAFIATADGQNALEEAQRLLEQAATAVAALDGAEVFGRSSFLSLSLGVRLPARQLAALEALDCVALVEIIGSHFVPQNKEGQDSSSILTAPPQIEPVYGSDLLGVMPLHEAGITGEGMLVAVIDSGFDVEHPVFTLPPDSDTPLTKEKLEAVIPSLSTGIRGVDRVWVSEKIPFVYDYCGEDTDVSSADIHGTHVASILGGGDDGTGHTVGVAPDAQLLLMKVFDDNAMASDYALYRAVEDALMLGAQVVSLSLGSAPGYPYATNTFSVHRHLEKARTLGCAVICAAGNDGAVGAGSGYDGTRGIDFPLAANPDYGLIAEPASYPSTLAVGAYVPDRILSHAVGAGNGSLLGFSDSAAAQGFPDMTFTSALDGETLAYLAIPGVGRMTDYEGLDVSGKLALVRRGEISFTEKLLAAYAAGAVGMLCYDHSEGELFRMAFDEMPIPAISISLADGEALAAAAEEERIITVSASLMRLTSPSDAGEPAAYSARGSGLTIRPSLLAPGTIYAAVPGGGYASQGGTSMATPLISGLATLWLNAYQNQSKHEYETGQVLLDNLWAELITTAEPILDESGNPYPVRVQGGGAVDAAALFASSATLRAEDGRGLVELGDGLSPDGEFTFTLTLTNHTHQIKSYAVSASVSSDDYFLLKEESGTTAFAADRTRVFRQAKVMLNGQNINRYHTSALPALITLRPGESRTMTFTVSLSSEEAKEYSSIFTGGFYLEGYVWVEDDRGEALSLPYLGFAGDFDKLPYFDVFGYDGDESFFAQNLLYARAGDVMLNLGCNFYAEDSGFYRDLIAISPNGDGMLDEAMISLYLLRNLYCLESFVTDEAGQVVWQSNRSYYLTKAFLDDSDRMQVNQGSAWGGQDDDNPLYVMPDGRYTLTYRVLNPGDTVAEEISLPIVIDTAPPVLEHYFVSTERDENDGNMRRLLTLTLTDKHYPMRAVLYRNATDSYGRTTELYRDAHNITYKPGHRGVTLVYDITAFSGDYLYLDVYDYAMNRFTYRIPLED